MSDIVEAVAAGDQRNRSKVFWILQLVVAALLLVVLGAVTAVWAFQTYGIYSFNRETGTPGEFGHPEVRVVSFKSSDGATVNAWISKPKQDRPVIVSFYGNAASIGPSFDRLSSLLDQGYGLAMMEYRGSGATGGTPAEMNFAKDAEVFYDQLDSLMGHPVPAEQRVLHGFSLGAGVGSRLAAERPFAAVILEASPYRTCLFYQDGYFGFPFCRLMWAERYDIIDHVKRIPAPKLIIHGELDDALPVERARLLFEEAPEPKQFVEIAGGHHADLSGLGLLPAMTAFVDKWTAPKAQ